MQLPSAIIFVNNDLNEISKSTLLDQLKIHESISHQEFNDRVTVDPNYVSVIHNTNTRILVFLPTFQDLTNRELADIVIFVKQGLAAIEINKYGPHGLTVPIYKINIYELLKGAKIVNVTVGFGSQIPLSPKYIINEDGSITNGIFTDHDLNDPSGVHLPNPDNIYNNQKFITRKP